MLWKKTYSDIEIIEGLKSDSKTRRTYENYLYETYFYLVKECMKKYSLSREDALSVYADSLLILIENIINNIFERKSKIKTYFIQIFYNKTVSHLEKKQTNREKFFQDAVSLDSFTVSMPDDCKDIIQILTTEEYVEELKQALANLDDKCRRVLLYWSEGYNDDEIAKMVEYSSGAVVKTTRHRCMERLRAIFSMQKQSKS